MAFDRNIMAVVQSAPIPTGASTARAPLPDDCCPVPELTLSSHSERLLYRLAQSELTHLTAQLTALCRDAVGGQGSDKMRLETLHQLSQRLDIAGTVLAELGGSAAPAVTNPSQSLLHVLQGLIDALDGLATERRIRVSIDIAGAIRRPVAADVTALLRLLLETAIRATAADGRLDIVTRREGDTAAISVALSAVRGDNAPTGGVLDLAILRNLALRRGGRLAVVHRHALGQQWILRLPLGANVSEDNVAGNCAPTPLTRLSQLVFPPNEDGQIA